MVEIFPPKTLEEEKRAKAVFLSLFEDPEDKKLNDEYWKKVKRYVPLLKMVPFVRMVAVCNTMAFRTPEKGSDIDIFIIVKDGRIFTARTLSTLMFHFLGVRRHGKKITKRFCLSFYLADSDMGLSDILLKPYDVYMYFWMRTLKPVFGVDKYGEFCRENGIESNAGDDKNGFFKMIGGVQEWILNGRIGNYLEETLEKIHQRRHEKRLESLGDDASVVVSNRMLKYHNKDMRKYYNDEFMKRYYN